MNPDEDKKLSVLIRVHPWQESVFSRLLFSTLIMVVLPAAHAQFALSVLNGNAETPVTSSYDFGTTSAGDIVTANFRLPYGERAGHHHAALCGRGGIHFL